MSSPNSSRRQQIRIRISQEAARLMVEHGIRDYRVAKRKAALRLGVSGTGNLPRNDEIESARMEYQRLFGSRQQRLQLHKLRTTALRAMELLEEFQPRLVGAVLSGSAGRHDPVTLHLFSDTAEEIAFLLMEKQIPFHAEEFRQRLNGLEQSFPGYRFNADQTEIELVIFPSSGVRQAPLSPVDGKPMRRAKREQVARLLEQDPGAT